jgi:hypothetical protein
LLLPWTATKYKKVRPNRVTGRSNPGGSNRIDRYKFYALPAELTSKAQTPYPIIGSYEVKLRSEWTTKWVNLWGQ